MTIITPKVYTSRRAQDCITSIARAAKPVYIDYEPIKKGDIIPVHPSTHSVKINDLTVKSVKIIRKMPSRFKEGFWDIQIAFTLKYTLAFLDSDNNIIVCVDAYSVHKKKYTLFGSTKSDTTFATDLFIYSGGKGFTASMEPLVIAKASAVALKAEVRYHCGNIPMDVAVTIGLFSIIKLSRIVCLNVESRGIVIPCECDELPCIQAQPVCIK